MESEYLHGITHGNKCGLEKNILLLDDVGWTTLNHNILEKKLKSGENNPKKITDITLMVLRS